jgi:hypothetical protein
MGIRGEIVRKAIGWVMMGLGVVVLAGALADSKVGAGLRTPKSDIVTAPVTGIDRISIHADRLYVFIDPMDRADLAVLVRGSHSGWVDTQVTSHGNDLQVRVSAPWWHMWRHADPTFVEVHVPVTFAEAIQVEVGEGSLTIGGPSHDRPTWTQLDVQVRTARVDSRFSGGRR